MPALCGVGVREDVLETGLVGSNFAIGMRAVRNQSSGGGPWHRRNETDRPPGNQKKKALQWTHTLKSTAVRTFSTCTAHSAFGEQGRASHASSWKCRGHSYSLCLPPALLLRSPSPVLFRSSRTAWPRFASPVVPAPTKSRQRSAAELQTRHSLCVVGAPWADRRL